jgi:tetratricopeptide (TPR) repeat protein
VITAVVCLWPVAPAPAQEQEERLREEQLHDDLQEDLEVDDSREHGARVDELREQGMELYEQRYYLGAVEKWNQALDLEPWNEEIRLLVEEALARRAEVTRTVREAYLLLDEGRVERAGELLARAREKSSPRGEELYGLIVRGMRAVERALNRERYLRLIEEGDRRLEREDFQGAREYYAVARKFDPEGTLHRERIALLERRVRETEVRAGVERIREEAAGLYHAGEYGRSREAWNRLLSLSPGDQEALLFLSKIDYLERRREQREERARGYFDQGTRLYREQRYEQAIAGLESAAALGYREDEARALIEEIRETMARLERERRERSEELVAGYLREGIKLYNLNRYRESLGVLNKGLELDPENTQIREYILRDTIALREQEEREVPPGSPFYPLVQDLARLAGRAFREGAYEESVRRWEEILLIFPFNERARKGLARTLMKTDPGLASEILEGSYREAKALLEAGERREAGARLRMIVEVDPGFRDAAGLLEELDARERRERAAPTEQDRRRARDLHREGLEHYRNERLEEAVAALRDAVRLDPGLVEARVDLSRVEVRLRNLRRLASADGRGGGELSGEQRIALRRHYLNGVGLFLDGLYREAITEWEQVVKLDPDYENVRVNIQRARQRLAFEKSS